MREKDNRDKSFYRRTGRQADKERQYHTHETDKIGQGHTRMGNSIPRQVSEGLTVPSLSWSRYLQTRWERFDRTWYRIPEEKIKIGFHAYKSQRQHACIHC